jgi:predicted ATPase
MKLISTIQLNNFLSFSEDSKEFDLTDLNVLIGTNGSGKSNFLDAIAILRSFSNGETDKIFNRGGGIQQWIFNRKQLSLVNLKIVLESEFENPIEHEIEFQIQDRIFNVFYEKIEDKKSDENTLSLNTYYRFTYGMSNIAVNKSKMRLMPSGTIVEDASVLSQLRDPENYPEISRISELYSKIRMYRNWEFGRTSVLRNSQQTDLRSAVLEEDFSNFFIFLNRLFKSPGVKKSILESLQDLNENISDIFFDIESQRTQLFITEKDIPYSSSRLSDGTLRYLVLLAILLDPEPPPLICIEEPELGLHPDLISNITKLLIEASSRTQLIVTTHSELLIDGLSKTPESVVVCEKVNGETVLTRLEPERLKIWLEKYRLGEVWLRGELGGVRW